MKTTANKIKGPPIDCELADADLIDKSFHYAPYNIAVHDLSGRFIGANPAFLEFLGFDLHELLMLQPMDLKIPFDLQPYQEALLWVVAKNKKKAIRLASQEDPLHDIHQIVFVPELGPDGRVRRVFSYGQNIAAVQSLENAVSDAEKQLSAAIKVMPDIFWIKDAKGKYKHCNDKFLLLINSPMINPIGKGADDFMGGDLLARHRETDHLAWKSRNPVRFEIQLPADGETERTVYEIQKLAIRNADDQVTGIVGVARDVTEDRKLREDLHKIAYTDSLTGLQNRLAFNEGLQGYVDASRAQDLQCALFVLDLDRFKSINDNLGHLAGDEVLIRVAQRLSEALGDQGTVFRLSGDEFAIITPNVTTRRAAERIAENIKFRVKQQMMIENQELFINVSIGIVLTSELPETAATLYRFADMCLYEAKAVHGASFCFFTQEVWERSERRFVLEAMLDEGLLKDQFQVFFQEKVDLKTGRFVGAEALCRWKHPAKGWILPTEFIQIAEDTGQILQLGRLVFEKACAVAVQCNRAEGEPFPIAINVSPRQLLDESFFSDLKSVLSETGCKPEWIEIEITESVLLAEGSKASKVLKKISKLGVSIAIDDFGTGYSSLSYLHRFPIDVLKIDQSFIRDMNGDPKKLVVLKAIIMMAQGLGIKTVAEGIETKYAADQLRAFNCDLGQGYLWSKPGKAEGLLGKLEEQRA
ncbi:EAL domain-containing protein [uncultured Cohaesibacter sp.]|uniref:putative bifunctional diguanylate cyclase/phosphodiesterase n=1 Tax=uncultured Cohaesibacter sp. TaxID=1002546 RepID=UPI0029C79990|nr:EAL domain-containing protein [uncultured Cohaesibacter sp.]